MGKTLDWVIGCPDNPVSKAEGMFRGGSYLMRFQGGYDQFEPALRNGVIEIHFQQFMEVPPADDSDGEFRKLRKYADRAKEHGINLMAHLPFLIDKRAEAEQAGEDVSSNGYDGFFNFDFSWLVVPESYRQSPSVVPARAAQAKSDKVLNARETGLEDVFRAIDVADEIGIELLTVHATKPGVFFAREEFEKYKARINEIQGYIRKKQSNVKLCVETGGIRPEELVELAEDCGTFINMDTAHFWLDAKFLEGDGVDADRFVVDFVRDNIQYIRNAHLTQTFDGVDAHRGIHERGNMRCNEEVLKMIDSEYKAGRKILCMAESNPALGNIVHARMAVEGEFDAKPESQRENAYVTLVIGMPASGKSTVMGFIEDRAVPIVSDTIHETLLRSADTLSVEDFNETIKQSGYNILLSLLEAAVQNGENAVVDATYHRKERRGQLYEMLGDFPQDRMYVIRVESNDRAGSLAKPESTFGGPVIAERKARVERLKKEKKTAHFGLWDFPIYRKLIGEYEPFEHSELPDAHAAYINVSNSTITLHNPDSKLREMVEKVVKGYKAMDIEMNVLEG